MTNPLYNHRLGQQQSQASWYSEDIVDFPCAPCWIARYAHRGMTSDYPSQFYDHSGERIEELKERVQRLEQELQLLKTQEVRHSPPKQQVEPKPRDPYRNIAHNNLIIALKRWSKKVR